MMENHVGGLPIVGDDGTIEGMVTRTDLIRTFV
jgi:CBS domain-containing protein